jgi:hypothetical protein
VWWDVGHVEGNKEEGWNSFPKVENCGRRTMDKGSRYMGRKLQPSRWEVDKRSETWLLRE